MTLPDLANITISDEPADIKKKYDGRFEIVSTTAFLLGVPEHVFKSDTHPIDQEIFDKLSGHEPAILIRKLSELRTSLLLSFNKIISANEFSYWGSACLSYGIPVDNFTFLQEQGIRVRQNARRPIDTIIDINSIIQDRINNCKDLLPEWLNWEYYRNIFIMPGGCSEIGEKRSAAEYHARRNMFPYKVYMNWSLETDFPILFNDKTFTEALYKMNNDEFVDAHYVSDLSVKSEKALNTFIEESEKTMVCVDCENADPFLFEATLRHLSKDNLNKLSKIVFYYDKNASMAWREVSKFMDADIEVCEVARIRDHKSLTDMSLSLDVCKEYYENNIDSVILVSSDSDYWELINRLDNVKFLTLVERDKISSALKEALINTGVYYCYADSSYSGEKNGLREKIVFNMIQERISAVALPNVKECLDEALCECRIHLSEEELSAWEKKLLKNFTASITPEGKIDFKFNL